MSYICHISQHADYLRADVSGDWSPGNEKGDALDVWTQVAESYLKGRLNRVLAVWDVPGRLPTMAAFNLGSKIDALGVGRQFKLAIVHLKEDRLEDSKFAETVAVNRGYRIKVFGDEETAQNWLLSQRI